MQPCAVEIDREEPLPESSWEYWRIEGGEDDLRAIRGGCQHRRIGVPPEEGVGRDAERFHLSGTHDLLAAGTIGIDHPQPALHRDRGIRVSNECVNSHL